MDYNYENLLNQLEYEIDHIQTHFKQQEEQILLNISRLRKSEQHVATTAGTSSAHCSFLQHQEYPPPTQLRTIAETSPDLLISEIDKQLGGFYGSMELRDGLKEAHTKMDAVVSVLKRVREFVRSQFVRLQIEQLQENIALLQEVFVRLNKRMELPDSDKFFNEALSETGSSEKSSKKVSKEKNTSKEKASSDERETTLKETLPTKEPNKKS